MNKMKLVVARMLLMFLMVTVSSASSSTRRIKQSYLPGSVVAAMTVVNTIRAPNEFLCGLRGFKDPTVNVACFVNQDCTTYTNSRCPETSSVGLTDPVPCMMRILQNFNSCTLWIEKTCTAGIVVAPPLVVLKGTCPSPFKRYKNRCMTSITVADTFCNSQIACMEIGGRLLVHPYESDPNYLKGLAGSLGVTTTIWVGAYTDEANYRWMSGKMAEMSTSIWIPSLQSASPTVGSCAIATNPLYLLEEQVCSDSAAFICELPSYG